MAIASARVQVLVIPGQRGAVPISLGIVEDFRCEKTFQSEIHHSLGTGPGVDGTVNTEEGMISWGRVPKFEQRLLDAITPRIAQWLGYERINLAIVDLKSGELLIVAVGIVPEQLGFNFQNGRAVRENFRGRCQYIVCGQETAQAGAATQGQVPDRQAA